MVHSIKPFEGLLPYSLSLSPVKLLAYLATCKPLQQDLQRYLQLQTEIQIMQIAAMQTAVMQTAVATVCRRLHMIKRSQFDPHCKTSVTVSTM